MRQITGLSCGCDVCIHNAAYRVFPGCANCDPEEVARGLDRDDPMCDEIGACSCYTPDRLDEIMLEFLESFSENVGLEGYEDKPPTCQIRCNYQIPGGPEKDLHLVLLYLADSLGWTEHGSSVSGCWLDDNGVEARENLRKHLSKKNQEEKENA